MIELVKEILDRKWSFVCEEGVIYIVLANDEYAVRNDEDAAKVLHNIRTYW